MNKKYRVFNSKVLEAKMPGIREETYLRYKKFLEELPEWMSIDREMSIADHCKNEKVSSNTSIVMQMAPLNLLTRKLASNERADKRKVKYRYYLNYEVTDDDFNRKARMLAAACNLYGLGSKQPESFIERVKHKSVKLSTSDSNEDFTDNAKKVMETFDKKESWKPSTDAPWDNDTKKTEKKPDKIIGVIGDSSPEERFKKEIEKPKRINVAMLIQQLGLAIEQMATFGNEMKESKEVIENSLKVVESKLAKIKPSVDGEKGFTLNVENINIYFGK